MVTSLFLAELWRLSCMCVGSWPNDPAALRYHSLQLKCVFAHPCVREKTTEKVSTHTSSLLPFIFSTCLTAVVDTVPRVVATTGDCCQRAAQPPTSVCLYQAWGSLLCEECVCSFPGLVIVLWSITCWENVTSPLLQTVASWRLSLFGLFCRI